MDNSTQYNHPAPVEKSCRMHRAIPLVSVLKMIDWLRNSVMCIPA